MTYGPPKKRLLRKAPHYKVNPFGQPESTAVLTVFQPSDYALAMMAMLSPAALRVLVYMCAKMKSDGSVYCPLNEVKRLFPHPVSTLSVGVGELMQYDLVKRRTRSEYWVSPMVAKPLLIQGS
ncbi:MAG: hypothetical protein EAZ91_14140 [Cytophagales bacterium]|nr:MAG: hypothetical protein EAZ91_14140 [Cytophagales bacterium]